MQSEPINLFEIESERAYVVYHPRSGEILHEHIVTNYKNSRPMSPKQEEAQAVELAKRYGHTVRGMKVLAVDPKRLDGSTALRVDIKTSKLVVDRSGEKASD
jgi:hypothetical protein